MVKTKRIKQKKVISEDESQIKTLIILFIIVILVCVGIYFLTDTMIKRESNKEVEKIVEINYDIATVGTMFNRIEKEYYVLLYSNEKDGNKLNGVLDTYRSSDTYIKTYYVDLDIKFNSVLGDELNESPKNSKEVKVNGATLYKINNGKVIECISGVDNIVEKLK